MPIQDTSEIKQKIISSLQERGPSLPVQIAREVQQSILFTSAFLSELVSEKKIKITNMKIGGSPLYFLPEQIPQLDKFGENLKSKEKDAFLLLKQKKFLDDEKQEPAIRVALRAIRDFAFPFRHQEKIYWRYFKIPLEEFSSKKTIQKKPLQKQIKKNRQKSTEKQLDIFSKPKTKQKKPKTSKQDEKFFNKVKEFLSEKNIRLIDIESFNKKELCLKINNGTEKLVVAYNKKRITEKDIINAHKKASELRLPYIILSLGEPLKKITNFINAARSLVKIDKI